MDIGKYLKDKRKQRGLTLEDVAKACEVNNSTASRWETGDINNMRRDKIQKLASILGITPAEIVLGEKPNVDINSPIPFSTKNMVMLPVFETVSAGFGSCADSHVVAYEPAFGNYNKDENCWIIVKGDSMSPKIQDGDYILIQKQSSVDSGDIAVVLVDGEEGVVKKVVYDESHVDLISINPKYKPRTFSGEDLKTIRILGKVIMRMSKF